MNNLIEILLLLAVCLCSSYYATLTKTFGKGKNGTKSILWFESISTHWVNDLKYFLPLLAYIAVYGNDSEKNNASAVVSICFGLFSITSLYYVYRLKTIFSLPAPLPEKVPANELIGFNSPSEHIRLDEVFKLLNLKVWFLSIPPLLLGVVYLYLLLN